MSTTNVFRVGIPESHRSLSGAATFTVSEDGRGTVIGTDGAPKANFEVQRLPSGPQAADSHSRQFAFKFARVGAPQLNAQYQVRKDDNCNIIVEGQANGANFSVAASLEGKVLESSVPAQLATEDQPIIHAMSAAMVERHRFHAGFGCALAGAEVLFGAFTLDPFAVAFGFVGIVAECSD